MNRLPIEKRVQILHCFVEGCSLRATSRMVDVSINTVSKFLVDLGYACAFYQNETLRNLSCKRVQADEIWSFCYSKQKNVPAHKIGEAGDIWTWVGMCAETKLVLSWLIGWRDAAYANVFIADLAGRLKSRTQLTTDGNKTYLQAVEDAFGGDIDYAMLVKIYGASSGNANERRYSAGECCGAIKGTVCGDPQEAHISTSFVERQNLTMRMGMRRFTRLTNGFSKKIANHEHAVAIHYMHYNFGRIHKTLRVSPAMEAKVTNHLWSLEEIAKLAD